MMQVRRFGAPLGAIVEGIDVREIVAERDPKSDQSAARWRALNELFCTHKVLVFPGQRLTPDDQKAFARLWGDLLRHPYAGLEAHPDIIELTNVGKRRDINQHWHSDMTYEATPPKLTMLYALQAPDIGGDTAFANQELAYRDLSPGLRASLDTLRAEHTAAGLARVYGENSTAAPTAVHPVIRTHDETGDRALYVCRAFTRTFVGFREEESKSLLSYLFEHSTRPEYQARHRWQSGDLVMWDNRSVLHFAVHDHADDQPRRIHRLQVAGPVPA